MRPRYLLAPLLLVLVALGLSACDSSDDNTIDAEFFVDSWTLVGLGDSTNGARDRSDEIDLFIDDIAVTFQSDDDFSILVDYTQFVNDLGTEDATITGTFDVSAAEALILTVDDQAASFNVTEQENGEVELSASAIIVNELLASVGLDLDLEGTVVLTIERT